ncbi:MAG: hypothetical protein AB7E80_17515 [Hyphomicrobiaceae bacterium]
MSKMLKSFALAALAATLSVSAIDTADAKGGFRGFKGGFNHGRHFGGHRFGFGHGFHVFNQHRTCGFYRFGKFVPCKKTFF